MTNHKNSKYKEIIKKTGLVKNICDYIYSLNEVSLYKDLKNTKRHKRRDAKPIHESVLASSHIFNA